MGKVVASLRFVLDALRDGRGTRRRPFELPCMSNEELDAFLSGRS